MARTKYHVVPRSDGDWAVKKAGASRASYVYENKKKAKKKARKLAKNSRPSQVYYHNRDGRITEDSTYPDNRNVPG